MEEHGAVENLDPAGKNTSTASESPPRHPLYGKHKPYPDEQRRDLLQAYASWTGSTDAFCAKHGIFKGTLWAWRRKYRKEQEAVGHDGSIPSKRPLYSPEQRRQAVEVFAKSGQSLSANKYLEIPI